MGWQFWALGALVILALIGIAAIVRFREGGSPASVLDHFQIYPELD